MAHARNQPVTALEPRLRGALGRRFARFAGAALAALTATEAALTICNGVFRLASTPAALVSWFAGAVVSYALSRWAWNRKGRPDVLRETIPFWVISVTVVAVLTLANEFGYRSATWLHLTGAKHVLWVDFVWLAANLGTFLLRFAIFHYVLFTDRPPIKTITPNGPWLRESRDPLHSNAKNLALLDPAAPIARFVTTPTGRQHDLRRNGVSGLQKWRLCSSGICISPGTYCLLRSRNFCVRPGRKSSAKNKISVILPLAGTAGGYQPARRTQGHHASPLTSWRCTSLTAGAVTTGARATGYAVTPAGERDLPAWPCGGCGNGPVRGGPLPQLPGPAWL